VSDGVFQFQRRVVYADCTVGNHVYYARYLDMLEEARGELFRQAGWPLRELQEAGVIFPVIGVAVSYQAPARYDDVIAISLQIIELGSVRLNFGFQISNADGKALADGETRHVCAGLDEKPKRLPKGVAEKLRPFLRVPPHAT
jgi:acyl-CoA thioester hydrolase